MLSTLGNLARATGIAAVLTLSGPTAAKDLRIALAAEPSAMDPHFHNLTPNNALTAHVFDRLIHFDPKQKPVAGLAESWTAVDDKTWELKLRKGVTWHDGSPFTADDVLFTMERAPNVENSPGSFGIYAKGKTFTKVDDHTVRVTTPAPYPLMPNDLTTIAIISKKHGAGAKTDDYNSGKAAIGTGPYKLVEFVKGDRYVLQRNDAYWGRKPQWEKVIVKPIKAGPARVAALLAGDVDLIEEVPTTDIARLKGEAKVALSQGLSNRVIYFHMDQWRDETPFITAKDGSKIKNPLKDKRVRLALSKAINRDAIVDRLMEGAAVKASQFLADEFFGTSKTLKPVAFDQAGAKTLLAEAGLPNGFKMTLHGPNGRYTNDARIAEAVAQMFTRIGVETAVETMPPAVFFNRASAGAQGNPEFSFILVGWGAGTGEVSSPLKSLVATFDKAKGSGAANRGRYSNPELDKVIAEGLATIDDDKRAALFAKASEIAIEDVAVIVTHYQLNTWGTRKGLKYEPRTDEYTVAMSASE
ncbi:MAG: ABC transporter substrate-binding protein [Hyphomicrobiaceae bacterium]|nr:ABC transporter substrate-binding protein [Hyphomicrobiaceae bacterium]